MAKAEQADPGIHATIDGVAHKSEVQSDSRQISDIIREHFPNDHTMLAIAKAESGLNPECQSNTDKLSDGRPFSIGLFQINLTVSEINGVNCSKAFRGINYDAVVIDEQLFEKCVNLAKNPLFNIKSAKDKYQNRVNRGLDGRGAWGAFTNKAYLSHL